MKCPRCGQWNIASLPRCFKCGEPLPAHPDYVAAQGPDWQQELKEEAPKVYVRADESGQAETMLDQRDKLAKEMVELKARKSRGEKHQRKLREETSRQGMVPSSMTVRTNTTRATVFRLEDDPETALRPIPPELVEEGEVPEGGKRAYTARFSRPAEEERSEEGFFPGTSATSQWVPPSGKAASQPVYDGFNDSSAYEPLWDEDQAGEAKPRAYTARRPAPRRTRRQKLFTFLLLLMLGGVTALAVITGVSLWQRHLDAQQHKEGPTVVASIVNDQAAHTITIPGADGTQIYVKELSNTYTISGGKAVLEVPDYIWYSNYEDLLSDTMDVTISPFTRLSSGKLTPLEPISYQIQIPLSPIELVTPDLTWVEVATAMYPMKFRVREDSRVTINGGDYSDLVSQQGGEVTYNATVQPIGDNKITIKVHSQYCRENVVVITLFRAKQEVPLDLVSDQTYNSSKKSMKVTATTIPGADVEVLTPNTDLNVTTIGVDGTFSFYAVFGQIGNNLVTIQASMPGRKPSVLSFDIYYVPPADEYTKKAWGLDYSNVNGKANYADLLTNNAQRVKSAQIYVCTGVITQIISNKPQLAILNAGTEEAPMNVMLENSTRTTWVEGKRYQIFADAYGMYTDMPRLIARYTYKK